ncbi:hypothetical protein AAVH_30696, partial [Aphelenchoides avenae]
HRPLVLPVEAVADAVSFLDRLGIERALMVGRQFTQAADHLLTSANVPLRSFDVAGIGYHAGGSPYLLAILAKGVRRVFYNPDVWEYVVRWSAVKDTCICAFNFETPVVTC